VIDWSYAAWPSGEPYAWGESARVHPDDRLDFHVDLGCGKLKKGRIGVDHRWAEGVNVVADLDRLETLAGPLRAGWPAVTDPSAADRHAGLPFPDHSIESIVSHHCLEHIGAGFLALMDDCWRVLAPGAPFRIIVPLFPSTTAVEDPDHKRWFMERTFDSFCGTPEHIWCESFSVPYTRARFELTHRDATQPTPPPARWTDADRRELRLTLRAVK
jgi:SAM-dependent methyltransferase